MALSYKGYIYLNPVNGLAPGALLTHFAPIALSTQSINNYTLTYMTSIHAFDRLEHRQPGSNKLVASLCCPISFFQ